MILLLLARQLDAAHDRARRAEAERDEWAAQSYRDRVRADHNAELAYTQRQAALRAEGVPEKAPPIWIGGDAA